MTGVLKRRGQNKDTEKVQVKTEEYIGMVHQGLPGTIIS